MTGARCAPCVSLRDAEVFSPDFGGTCRGPMIPRRPSWERCGCYRVSPRDVHAYMAIMDSLSVFVVFCGAPKGCKLCGFSLIFCQVAYRLTDRPIP